MLSRTRTRIRTVKFLLALLIDKQKTIIQSGKYTEFYYPFQESLHLCHHHHVITPLHDKTDSSNQKIVTHFKTTENSLHKQSKPNVRPPESTTAEVMTKKERSDIVESKLVVSGGHERERKRRVPFS